MKPKIRPIGVRPELVAWWLPLWALVLLAGSLHVAMARPRPLLPPYPEATLTTFGFDEPLAWGGVSAFSARHQNVVLVESWSGYALKMAGQAPMLSSFPVLDEWNRPNLRSDQGTIRFWFRPYWSSGALEGTGPGAYGRLVELGAWSQDARYGWMSLYVDPKGDAIYFSSQGDGQGGDYLKVPIQWKAGEWHQVTLTYSAKATALYLDGELAGQGEGLTHLPGAKVIVEHGLCVGSDSGGENLAQGEFEELTTFAEVVVLKQVALNHQQLLPTVRLGPITPAEDQARRENTKQRAALRLASADESFLLPSGEGAMSSLMAGLTISIPVFTNQATNLFFTLQNTETDAAYEILWSTNLPATAWTSVARGVTNQVNFLVPAPVLTQGFYQASGPLCIFAPTPLIVVEDVLSPLTNLTLTGFAGFNGTLHCSVTNGRLWLLPTNGLTFLNSTNGTTSLTVTGAFTNLGNALSGLLYLGKTNFFGQDRLTLVLTNAGDGGVLSDRLVNSITVLPVNDPPYAPSETYYVTSGVTLPAAQGLLHNATDPDGDSLVVFSYFTETAQGQLWVYWDGSIHYFAHGCYSVSETFTYQIIDNFWDGYLFWRKSAPISFTIHATVPQYLPYTDLYAPTNGQVVVQGLNLDITAYADPSWCNELSQVKFFAGTNLIGTVSNGFVSPPGGQYVSMIWSNVPPGTHALSTLAMTTSGLSWTSSVVTITATLLPNGDVDGDGMTNAVDPFPYDFYNAVVPALTIAGGNDQAGPTGAVLANPLQVLVTTAAGVPLTNAPVTFVSVQGGGLIANPAGGGYSSSVLVRSGTTGHASVLAKAPTTVSTFGSVTATASASTGDRVVSFLTASTNQVSGGTTYLQVFTPLK